MPNRVHQKRLERLKRLNEPVNKIVETVVEKQIVEEPIVEEQVIKEEIPVGEPTIKSEDELKSLNKAELIVLAEQLGLDTTGTKSELIDRILG